MARVYSPKACQACSVSFQPRGGRSKYCDGCRPEGKTTAQRHKYYMARRADPYLVEKDRAASRAHYRANVDVSNAKRAAKREARRRKQIYMRVPMADYIVLERLSAVMGVSIPQALCALAHAALKDVALG